MRLDKYFNTYCSHFYVLKAKLLWKWTFHSMRKFYMYDVMSQGLEGYNVMDIKLIS